jgi:2-oxoglutarate ferredoxin oxidoreductase subunit alpha
VFGRTAAAPAIVNAARSAPDCFDCGIEAVRLATRFMSPVILLTDGYLANAAEPWQIPDISTFAPFPVEHRTSATEDFKPYERDLETLARPWVVPGTKGLVHRIGSLERADGTGNISYDAANHQRMTLLRLAKVAGVAKYIPHQRLDIGEEAGDLLVLGWGSTYGAIHTAVADIRVHGHRVSSAHVRYLSPFPPNLGAMLSRFKRVLVPELNAGQLARLLRSEFDADIASLSKVAGQPFKVREIRTAILEQLNTL